MGGVAGEILFFPTLVCGMIKKNSSTPYQSFNHFIKLEGKAWGLCELFVWWLWWVGVMLEGGEVRSLWEGSVGIHGVVAGGIGYQW